MFLKQKEAELDGSLTWVEIEAQFRACISLEGSRLLLNHKDSRVGKAAALFTTVLTS